MNEYLQDEEVHLRDYLNVLFRHRRLILLTVFATVLGTFLYLLRSPRIYEAASVVRISQTQMRLSVLPEGMLSPAGGSYNPIESEIEIIKSRSLQSRVYMQLGLNLKFKGLNGFRADSTHSSYPCRYGTYRVEIQEDSTVRVVDTSGTVVAEGKIGTLIQGPGFQFRLLPESNLWRPQTVELRVLYPSEGRVKSALKLSVSQKGATDLVTIRAKATSPRRSARIANAIAQEYIRFTLSGLREEARSMRTFIEEQLASMEKELREAERALQDFKEKEGIYELSATVSALTDQLSSLESARAMAVAEKSETEMLLQKYKDELAGQGFYQEYRKRIMTPELSTDPYVQKLREQISQLEIQKAELLSTYGAQHPKVVAIDQALAQTKEELRKVIQSLMGGEIAGTDPIAQQILAGIVNAEVKIHSLQGKIDALNQLITKYQKQLKTLPEKEVQLAELTRRASVARDVYSMLLNKLQETKIAEAGKVSDAKIVDPAIPPEKPIKPKPRRDLVLALIFGLFLGVGLAFVVEVFDDTVKTHDDIESLLGIPVLGVIPFFKEHPRGKETDISKWLVIHHAPKSPAAEAFRALRSNLRFTKVGQLPQKILITSAIEEEGKTTVAVNLAVAFTQTGKKALVVDADLRRPQIHRVFQFEQTPGLTDVIIGDIHWKQAVQQAKDIEHLYLLSSGSLPPNPAELLGSEKMNALLEELSKEFDIILFDTPPILPATDALELGTMVDAALIVARAGVTERSYLREVRRILDNIKFPTVGVVLNAVDLAHHYGYYRYRYYYYRYAQTPGSHRKRGMGIWQRMRTWL